MKFLKKIRAHHSLMFMLIFFISLLFNFSQAFQPAYWGLFITVFLVNTTAYMINDYFDRHDDALDPKKKTRNPFCSKKDFRRTKQFMLFLVLTTLALSFLSSLHLIIVLNFYFFVILYSHPSIKLKGLPIFDVIVHAWWFLTLFATGWIYSLPINAWFLAISGQIILYSTAIQLGQQTRDLKVDTESKLRTTTMILGEKNSRKASISLFFLAYSSFLLTMIIRVFF